MTKNEFESIFGKIVSDNIETAKPKMEEIIMSGDKNYILTLMTELAQMNASITKDAILSLGLFEND